MGEHNYNLGSSKLEAGVVCCCRVTWTDTEAQDTQSECSWQDGSEGDQAGRPTIEEVNSDGIQRVINLQPHQWYSAPCTE